MAVGFERIATLLIALNLDCENRRNRLPEASLSCMLHLVPTRLDGLKMLNNSLCNMFDRILMRSLNNSRIQNGQFGMYNWMLD